jgi:hypothetical protein
MIALGERHVIVHVILMKVPACQGCLVKVCLICFSFSVQQSLIVTHKYCGGAAAFRVC